MGGSEVDIVRNEVFHLATLAGAESLVSTEDMHANCVEGFKE